MTKTETVFFAGSTIAFAFTIYLLICISGNLQYIADDTRATRLREKNLKEVNEKIEAIYKKHYDEFQNK